MADFEFLSVLISIVIGFGLAICLAVSVTRITFGVLASWMPFTWLGR